MVKKSVPQKYEEDLDDDDFDYFDESSEENMNNIIGDFMEVAHQQAIMAMELTKIALSKKSEPNISEDTIFTIYKKALQVITETSPMKKLLEDL